ncbi:MAG: hypothetical protein E6G56_08960 [Actinobacteria bacterium]|nr:MAG: hypothetical protein E6G56_08960 [Actinomycetota bacterium]
MRSQAPPRAGPAGRRGRRRAPAAALACAAAALGAPAGASGDANFGSTLSAPATVAITQGADSAFWPTKVTGGASPVSPAAGQIVAIKVKGFARRSRTGATPLREIHFQDLRPQGGGSVQVVSSSQPFNLPVGGSPNRISTYRPTNMFIAAGDYIDFNDEGGFDPRHGFPAGVPFQVFAAVAGSVTQRYTKDNGTNNGDLLAGTPHADTELLMQVQLSVETPGPAAVAPTQTAPVTRAIAHPLIACEGDNTCIGHLLLTAHGADAAAVGPGHAARTVILGRGSFTVGPHSHKKVPVRLNRLARALLRKHHGRLRTVITVASGTGGPAHSANSTIRLALKRRRR